ncbi:EGFR-like transmembrane domain-containing protein [Kitasatospora sp. NBC_01266]|uniref:EGFR-like transmembrane domain-containing protein n=1 Tax=Kitasatospora sp. NBC_01266 TaxID=2903572 RepID=UPI002E34A991|nr:transmembrane domain-containing protein [Kitasatospora sp. NBC_01266]
MRIVLHRSRAAGPGAVLAILLGLLLLLAPGAAVAAGGLDDASAALKQGKVYVDPAMTGQFSQAQADALTKTIKDADKPILVAVVPATSQYPAATVIADLRTKAGVTGVYAVWRGTQFAVRTDGAALNELTARNYAQAAFDSHHGDINATLTDFVTSAAPKVRGHAPGSGGSGISAALIVVPLAILALVGVGGFLLVRRARKRREEQLAAELRALRTVVDEDITAFGEELERLDFTPGAPGADDAQRADYEHALDAYERAKRTMDEAQRPEDVKAVTEALEDGRFSLATLAARRAGRPLPERRPPCFFDPRHGPSVQDADWAPAGGATRSVPVCAADAQRLATGLDPAIRTVQTDQGPQPYWNAGPAYGPWAGGYFDSYGSGLLPGLLVGTMLGSVFSGPGGWSDGGYPGGGGFDGGFPGGAEQYQGGDFSGGDFNPADFGGFNGGDFGGGGDSGGGDFGGGDFDGGDFSGGGDW